MKRQKICYIWKNTFEHKYTNDKYNHKCKNPCHFTGNYRGAAHSICNLKYSIPKKVQVVFHNGSSYDYYFIIKQLAKEL